MEWLTPLIEQLGFGGIAGFCVGYFAKKVTKAAIFLIGGLIVLLQVLAYYHFVEINWGAADDAFRSAKQSGAIQSASSRLWAVLVHNIPFGGAFFVGFALGMKRG